LKKVDENKDDDKNNHKADNKKEKINYEDEKEINVSS